MNLFWKDVNNFFDNLFGDKAQPVDATGFPSVGDVYGADEYASYLSGSGSDQALTPDQAKDYLAGQGYEPPPSSSPFDVSSEHLFGVIKNRPPPFNTIDLNPAVDGGSRKSGTVPSRSNIFPASPTTLNQIAQVSGINLGLTASILAKTQQLGVTYEINITGNFLRLEKLPQGYASPQQLSQAISTQLIGSDAYIQNALQLMLGGCYIQFDSLDSPILKFSPGVPHYATFSKIYVTLFASSGRYRLITGSNADIKGVIDERLLRQNLAIWDGGGMLDSPFYHPVPFSIGTTIDGTDFINDSHNLLAAWYSSAFGNSDSGSLITNQASGTTVGTVVNNGYTIGWITSLKWQIRSNLTVDGDVMIGLKKSVPGLGLIPPFDPSYDSLWQDVFFAQKGSVFANPIQFTDPVRFVLAGFDQNNPATVGSGVTTGENLSFWGETIVATGNKPVRIYYSMTGYIVGSVDVQGTGASAGLIPYNPYPNDVLLPR